MSTNNLDSWDKFSGSFLKADMIKSENDFLICINVQEINDDGEAKVRLILEKEQNEFNFDLNKTNIQILKDLKIKSPKEILGKKIYFRIVQARNPQLNKEVPSLRISKIE